MVPHSHFCSACVSNKSNISSLMTVTFGTQNAKCEARKAAPGGRQHALHTDTAVVGEKAHFPKQIERSKLHFQIALQCRHWSWHLGLACGYEKLSERKLSSPSLSFRDNGPHRGTREASSVTCLAVALRPFWLKNKLTYVKCILLRSVTKCGANIIQSFDLTMFDVLTQRLLLVKRATLFEFRAIVQKRSRTNLLRWSVKVFRQGCSSYTAGRLVRLAKIVVWYGLYPTEQQGEGDSYGLLHPDPANAFFETSMFLQLYFQERLLHKFQNIVVSSLFVTSPRPRLRGWSDDLRDRKRAFEVVRSNRLTWVSEPRAVQMAGVFKRLSAVQTLTTWPAQDEKSN